MNKKLIFDFLKDLSNNNSKEWLDRNREKYNGAKKIWLEEIELILSRLAVYDSKLKSVQPKDTISRINNNRKFHPDKPVYKDNFTFAPYNGIAPASFYISISPKNSFMGGGLYHPDPKKLTKVREAIDYDGKKLKNIITGEKFLKFYGSLDEDEGGLRTAPKGYDKSHKYIDLLRRKNFTALIPLNRNDVISEKFINLVEEAFVSIKPLIDFLNDAVAFKE